MSGKQPTVGTCDNDHQSLRILSSILFERKHVRLFDYKDRWFHRRLQARLRSTQTGDVARYLDYLKAHPAEIDRLMDALAINISSFFRNPEVYGAVERHVFETWAAGSRKVKHTAWSCACAQGEEPYSLAMLWQAWKAKKGKAAGMLQLRIVASDIDRNALSAASAGVYPEAKRKEIPESFRTPSFLHTSGPGFAIKPELRAMVKFVEENVLMRAQEQKFDLILCRNLLIFLDGGQQEKLIRAFHDSLQPDGYLVMGKVESILHAQQEGFRAIDTANRIYRKVEKTTTRIAGEA